jgi:hypothetical protein
MAEWVFDKQGRAALIYDRDCFRSKIGKVVAWLSNNNVYGTNGRHRGWFEKGIFYDSNNRAVGFTRDATGSLPSRPSTGGIPSTPPFFAKPLKPLFAGTPSRPGPGGWSDEDLKGYLGG